MIELNCFLTNLIYCSLSSLDPRLNWARPIAMVAMPRPATAATSGMGLGGAGRSWGWELGGVPRVSRGLATISTSSSMLSPLISQPNSSLVLLMQFSEPSPG